MVGSGDTASRGDIPLTPNQQLGAVPGTAGVVPGHDGNEPEDDGVEFTSSGEAEHAPRDHADLDEELTDEYLEYIRTADLTAREAANVLFIGWYRGEL